MINFSTKLPDSRHSEDATPIGNHSLVAGSQKVATSPRQGAFAETLALAGVDPNATQVKPGNSTSQLPVTGQNPAAPETGWNALIPPTAVVASTVTGAPAASTTHWYASNASDDAYWAKQPAAVQQLREIENEPQRYQLASQLASEGYSIDVPIMVWGWDAGLTTQLRETDGYTWVPSALQQPISEAPGINTGGLTPYNPLSPPPGSILVG